MKKVMLINVLQPEETRIAILEDGVLQELYVERNSNESFVGNIYKGKIVNIEPSIQAAFVDFGVGRNGFLHISDVDPVYFEPGNGIERLLNAEADDRPEPKRIGPPKEEYVERTDTRDDWTFDDDDIIAELEPPRAEVRPEVREERPREDRARDARPRRDRPRGEGPREEPGRDERPRGDRPREDRPRDSRPQGGDRPSGGDRDGRGRRRGRGRDRDRGERRDRTPMVNDIPEEIASGNASLPSLDDLQLDDLPMPKDDFPPFDDVEPTVVAPPARVEEPRPAATVSDDEDGFGSGLLEPDASPLPVPSRRRGPEPRARREEKKEVIEKPKPIAPPPVDDDDGFGAGLIEELEDKSSSSDDEPPIETQSSVYRRTDEDDEFGGGLIDDDGTGHRSEREPAPFEHESSNGSDDGNGNATDGPRAANAKDEDGGEEGQKRRRHRRGGRGRRRGKRGDGNGGEEPTSNASDVEQVTHDEEPLPAPPRVDFRQPIKARTPEPEIDEIGWGGDDEGPDAFAPRDEPKPSEPPQRSDRDRNDRNPRNGRGDRGDRGDRGGRNDRDNRRGGRNESRGRPEPEPISLRDEPRRDEPRRDEPRRDGPRRTGPRPDIRGERDRGRDRGPRSDDRGRRDGRDRSGPRQSGGLSRRPRQRPPIQDIFRRGQEVMVQVIKEGIGNKGPTLSTYISIPGRYLVLMPGLSRVGVSRKIIDDEQRRKLRNIMLELERPRGVGFIVRTAGLERSKDELGRDMGYLARLWEVVVRRIRSLRGPGTIYQESDMIIRTIRDIVTGEIDAIYIDEPAAFERAKEFLEAVMPKYVNRLKLYDDSEPLFHHHGIEEEIAKIQKRSVPLPNGGSIVIDQTEALVAIDVNSGNFRKDDDAEETAYQINLNAAKEIARQLRLRDLGGVIVNDFIDMRDERHRRNVEQTLRDAVERDRARTKVLRMSQFGMIEMTRQRIRPSLKRSLYRECMACLGTGQIKTIESIAIECMRLLAYASQREEVTRINLTVDPEISTFLQNHKRKELAAIEDKETVVINILGKETRFPESLELNCFDARGDAIEVNLFGSELVARKG